MTQVHSPRRNFSLLSFNLALLLCVTGMATAQNATSVPAAAIARISTDTFTNSSSQHASEVEPDTYSFGSTIVSAFQVGRIFSGGGADIGYATSTDSGKTWTSGFLPGITVNKGGHFSAVSDASVAYDAKHGIWMINSLPIGNNNQISVSRSTDGKTWANPVTVSSIGSPDKNWIVCDNTPTSKFYGNCYVEWDDTSLGDQEEMNVSTDGGLTWKPAQSPADRVNGIGGQPLVLKNGTVVVPFAAFDGNMRVFSSTNGGASWGASTVVASVIDHGVLGGLRTSSLPSGEIDGSGKIYLVWQDCRFRSGCSANDIVLTTSLDGKKWTPVARIPIDATSSGMDHFIPGIGVDHATSGASAHLGLAYYYYTNTNCTQTTCKLNVGFVSSSNGGATWSAAQQLAGPMSLNNLPNTFSGLMVADYISVSYANGKAYPVFAVANPKKAGKLDQAMYTSSVGLLASSGPESSSANDRPVPDAKSDHPQSEWLDLDHEHKRPPQRRAAK